MSTDEWINVSRTKKGTHNKKVAAAGRVHLKIGRSLRHNGQISHNDTRANNDEYDDDMELNIENVIDHLYKTIDELLLSSYLKFLYEQIHEVVSKNQVVFRSIVGLGLGTLSSPTSVLQLAVYICLCRKLLLLDISDTSPHCSRVVFDPNMTSYDRTVCERLGITVLSTNLKGKHKFNNSYPSTHPSHDLSAFDGQSDSGHYSLFFLPHCPYRLYCNLLWENWHDLDKLFILGNRYSLIVFYSCFTRF